MLSTRHNNQSSYKKSEDLMKIPKTKYKKNSKSRSKSPIGN